MESVEELRTQLKALGYLSHGIERWFARDPWSSRAFWSELLLVAAKAATLVAPFAALPMSAIVSLRNHPLPLYETLLLAAVHLGAGFTLVFAIVVITALMLKLTPSLGVDRPRALVAISLGASALVAGAVAVWWLGFDSRPAAAEWLVALALLFLLFAVSTIVLSAALLSFAIHETGRIPAMHQRSRTAPISIAGAVLLAFIFVPAYFFDEELEPEAPPQIAVAPSSSRVAFVAVDGLTHELFASRRDLAARFAFASAAPRIDGRSAPERWASAGTGVSSAAHGVRGVEGIRLRGGTRVIQSVSAADVASAIGLATREPLPPTERKRDYVWEIIASRGISAAAINWWASDDGESGALLSIGQERLFAESRGGSPADLAVAIDRRVATRALEVADLRAPRLVALYLPALDIVLNRLELDAASRVASSLAALDALSTLTGDLRARGYEILLVGLPGDEQPGDAVIAATLRLRRENPRPHDLAPTILALFGFPGSEEMTGELLAPDDPQQRIPTYGARLRGEAASEVDPEYYEKLRSLGYVK